MKYMISILNLSFLAGCASLPEAKLCHYQTVNPEERGEVHFLRKDYSALNHNKAAIALNAKKLTDVGDEKAVTLSLDPGQYEFYIGKRSGGESMVELTIKPRKEYFIEVVSDPDSAITEAPVAVGHPIALVFIGAMGTVAVLKNKFSGDSFYLRTLPEAKGKSLLKELRTIH